MVWISGSSGGIGSALARTVPWPGARVIGIGRHPTPGAERLEADLADPAQWAGVGAAFAREAAGLTGGERVVFVQAAGTLDPIGFAGEVDGAAYARNVVLNAAAPQVLGHSFLAAVRHLPGPRHLLMLTSGAARSVYPGWSSYGAAKAAVDQWVRDVGAEQKIRGGVQVLSIAPGTVDTGMQAQLRATDEADFPSRPKFVALHADGKLADPDAVAADIWRLLDAGLENGSVVDLRNLPA